MSNIKESSKQIKKRSKKQSLAPLAAARGQTEANGGIRISKMKDVEVEVACTLKDMNDNVRKSPCKHGEIPPPIIPCCDSTPLQNVTTTHSSNPHDSTPLQNVTTTQPSNPHITPSNPQRSASPMNLDSFSEEANMVKTKRKGGKPMLRLFSLTPNEKVEIEFNDLNQPISPN